MALEKKGVSTMSGVHCRDESELTGRMDVADDAGDVG